MVHHDDVLKALGTCLDPELGIDIVSLGLIYKVLVEDSDVKITMTLTTPGCPLVPYFHDDIVDKVKKATGANKVSIDLSFDPPWDPSKMSELARQQLTMMRG